MGYGVDLSILKIESKVALISNCPIYFKDERRLQHLRHCVAEVHLRPLH